MQLPSTSMQQARHFQYDASGTITAGGTAQLVVPEHKSRALFFFQNISDTNMFVEFGSARATATLTNGAVTSISVTNAGLGFTYPPVVEFFGGGNTGSNMNNPNLLSAGQPTWVSPANPAQATAVLTGAAGAATVTSFVINNPGSGYIRAPYVFLRNSTLDPFGCAAPSATVGMLVQPGGCISYDGNACPTDPVAVFCATTGKAFTCKFMV